MVTAELSPTQRRVIGVVGFVVGFVTLALGQRAWYVMPTLLFVAALVLPLVTRRPPFTVAWVACAGAASILLAVFLKFA